MIYLVGAFEYSEDNDDWASIDPTTKPYRFLRLPEDIQNKSWEIILDLSKNALIELENEGLLKNTLIKKAKAITTGFDESELIKIR